MSTTSTHENHPLIVTDPSKGVKVDASSIAEPFRNEIKATVRLWKEQGIRTFVVVWIFFEEWKLV